MVRSGEIDLGLGMFIKPRPGLKRTSLFRFPLVVVRAREPRTNYRNTVRWADIRDETLIGLPRDNPMQQRVAQHLAKLGRREPTEIVTNYLATGVAMAARGLGVAILPASVLPVCIQRGAIMQYLVDPVISIDFYEIRNRGRALHPGADEFMGYLQEHIASWANQRAPKPS
jgi:DNA-binding transcriptional LysR family regulator